MVDEDKDERFGVHKNSILNKINTDDFSVEDRKRYNRNRKKFDEDQAAMNRWASQGYTSGRITEENDGT